MIYGFDTSDHSAATAALMVYAVWRSRDRGRFKVTPDVWGQIERFTKAAAKRAPSIPSFIEAIKPRMMCQTISPKWMQVGIKGEIPLVPVFGEDGSLRHVIQLQASDDMREFLTGVINGCDSKAVIKALYGETAWVILLVRDRLEREKTIESTLTLEQDQ